MCPTVPMYLIFHVLFLVHSIINYVSSLYSLHTHLITLKKRVCLSLERANLICFFLKKKQIKFASSKNNLKLLFVDYPKSYSRYSNNVCVLKTYLF